MIGTAAQGCSLLASNGEGFDGRRPWWRTAIGSMVAVGALTVWLGLEGARKDSAFRVLDDRIEHEAWKRPIYFSSIEAVVFDPPNGLTDVGGTVVLRLLDGTAQYLPFSLTGPNPKAFAADLRSRIDKLAPFTPQSLTDRHSR